jgi:ABC-type glycerol-3-phosphate transport system permease component
MIRRALAGTWWSYFLLVWIALFCLFPLAWMLSTSLKVFEETYVTPPTWWPVRPTVDAYGNIWRIQSFGTYFVNSTIVAGITTLVSLVLASLAGYGFSRFRFAGAGSLMAFILATQMFPGVLLVIPYFLMSSKAGLFNSYEVLIIAYTSFALPFCVWMLKGFFDRVPRELDEAALIDGTGRFGAFVRVALPLAMPGIVATAIFSFLVAWNEFLFAVALTSSPQMYLLTVGIASNIGQFRIQWNDLMAGAVVATVPIILLYGVLERYLVEGLTAGAVKG